MKFRLAFFFFMTCTSAILLSQTGSLKGKILNASGQPIQSVNILVKELGVGDASDANGNYKISSLPYGKYSVRFSSIGFKERNEAVIIDKEVTELNISMFESAIITDNVVVTASKYEQKLNELSVSAELMNKDFLEKKDFTKLDEALRYVPGVNFTLDQVSIRGSSGYSRGAGTRVLTAIDGIPIYTADTGEIIWEVIPIHEIQRIEVIKGASSSLYGSNAIGGVINVITNEIPDKPLTYFKMYGGLYDAPKYDEWDWSKQNRKFNVLTIGHANQINNIGYSFSLKRLENEGYRQNDFYKRYIAYLKFNFKFSTTGSIKFFANHYDQQKGDFIYWKNSYQALIPRDEDQGQKVFSNRTMIGAVASDVVSNDLIWNFKSSYYRNSWRDQTSSSNNSTSHLIRNEASITYTGFENIISIFGIEFSNGKVESNIFGNPTSYSPGIYLQTEYSEINNLHLIGGVRYDLTKINSLASSSAISPKIGLNYQISDQLFLRSSAGTAFRAPSLAEVFTSTTASGITIKPNPSLKSEKNYSFEFGVKYFPIKNISLDLAVFHNEYDELIEPGIDTDGKIRFNNVTGAKIQGVEFTSSFPVYFENLKASINYLYLNTKDYAKGTVLKYRPRHMVSASMDYTFSFFETGLDFRFWKKVEQIDFELIQLGLVPDGEKRSDVYVLDYRLAAPFNIFDQGFKAALNINNIFNYSYVEMIGNLSPIRNISLSLETKF